MLKSRLSQVMELDPHTPEGGRFLMIIKINQYIQLIQDCLIGLSGGLDIMAMT